MANINISSVTLIVYSVPDPELKGICKLHNIMFNNDYIFDL